jgi:hypothetical protein
MLTAPAATSGCSPPPQHRRCHPLQHVGRAAALGRDLHVVVLRAADPALARGVPVRAVELHRADVAVERAPAPGVERAEMEEQRTGCPSVTGSHEGAALPASFVRHPPPAVAMARCMAGAAVMLLVTMAGSPMGKRRLNVAPPREAPAGRRGVYVWPPSAQGSVGSAATVVAATASRYIVPHLLLRAPSSAPTAAAALPRAPSP